MKRRRSIVPENMQWRHVYTLPNGTVYVVDCAPYKAPTDFQRSLALKRAGIVLPQKPPAARDTHSHDVVNMLDANATDARGVPHSYVHLGKRITLYWSKEICVEGPALTARQKFEQRVYNYKGKGE